jgi:hypothetical protein
MLIIRLAVFAILFFAFSDILTMFSTFQDATAYAVGFGLALIASVAKIVEGISHLFAAAAGLGAIGIVVIIIWSLFAAVTLHLGIGGSLRKWRLQRQAEIEGMKATQGTARVTSAIRGLKEVEGAFTEEEKV